MSPDSLVLYLQANKVATSLSISQAEAERSPACLSLPCGVFTAAADRRRELFTSVSLCPHSVSAWHTAAPPWQRLSCLYHVEIWRSRLSAALPLWGWHMTASSWQRSDDNSLPTGALVQHKVGAVSTNTSVFLPLWQEITCSNPTCSDWGTSLCGVYIGYQLRDNFDTGGCKFVFVGR